MVRSITLRREQYAAYNEDADTIASRAIEVKKTPYGGLFFSLRRDQPDGIEVDLILYPSDLKELGLSFAPEEVAYDCDICQPCGVSVSTSGQFLDALDDLLYAPEGSVCGLCGEEHSCFFEPDPEDLNVVDFVDPIEDAPQEFKDLVEEIEGVKPRFIYCGVLGEFIDEEQAERHLEIDEMLGVPAGCCKVFCDVLSEWVSLWTDDEEWSHTPYSVCVIRDEDALVL